MPTYQTCRGKIPVSIEPSDVLSVKGIASLSDHFHTGFLGFAQSEHKTEITRKDGSRFHVSEHYLNVCADLKLKPL